VKSRLGHNDDREGQKTNEQQDKSHKNAIEVVFGCLDLLLSKLTNHVLGECGNQVTRSLRSVSNGKKETPANDRYYGRPEHNLVANLLLSG